MKKTIILVFFLLPSLFLSIYAQATFKTVDNVSGHGYDYRQARLYAFRTAIEQACGVKLESMTKVENFVVIADTIISSSQGFIQSSTGEKVEQNQGIWTVTYAQIIVSDSAASIADKVAEVSEGLKNLNFPRIGMKRTGVDPDFANYMQTFLVNTMNIPVVAENQSELILEPAFTMSGENMVVRGGVKNSTQQVVSSCDSVSLRYIKPEDKGYAAQLLIISLLQKLIIQPSIKINNLADYSQAEQLSYAIKNVNTVSYCSLQKYDKGMAEYDVRIRGNLQQLCSDLMKTQLFDSQQVQLDQPKRLLALYYAPKGGKVSKPVSPTSPSTPSTPAKAAAEVPPPPPMIEKLLQEVQALKDRVYKLEVPQGWPTNIWEACWNKEGGWIDFTNPSWLNLSPAEQFQYSAAYQRWYAQQKGLPVETMASKNGIMVFMRLVPPGKFMMGSPEGEPKRKSDENAHIVLIDKPFWIGKYEVSQMEWIPIMGPNPSKCQGAILPVEQVTWNGCKTFCERTESKLPTEEQWEYACRAGVTSAYNSGPVMNSSQVNWNNARPSTVGGGRLPNANAWGCYDFHGNVWEWCEDIYKNYAPNSPTDPKASRVIRGGSYVNEIITCRSANREKHPSDYKYFNLGFRIVVPIN